MNPKDSKRIQKNPKNPKEYERFQKIQKIQKDFNSITLNGKKSCKSKKEIYFFSTLSFC